MEFGSVEDALKFCENYAHWIRFGVAKSSYKKNDISNRFIFSCHKNCPPLERKSDKPPLHDRKCLILIIDFKTKITITHSNHVSVWKICKINLEYNHELCPNTINFDITCRDIPTRFLLELKLKLTKWTC